MASGSATPHPRMPLADLAMKDALAGADAGKGFPPMIARELFLRLTVVNGEDTEAFLGTQGSIWGTKSDMALAGLGALHAHAMRGRWHDRPLTALPH